MRINRYLLVAITPLLLLCCGNSKRLPKRKEGDACNITFTSNIVGLTCDNPQTVKMNNGGNDLELHLNIPYISKKFTGWKEEPTLENDGELNNPNTKYNVNVGDIAITIGGERFDESFTYFGETNMKNVLTIDKDYIVNDIEINVTARDCGRLFLFGYQFGNELKDRIDTTERHTNSDKDITLMFVSEYQRVEKPIHTLGEMGYPIFEDDSIDLTIEVKEDSNEPLPNNIWLRSNARYTSLGNDFFREYKNEIKVDGKIVGYRTCHIYIPNYIIRDHGSFVQFNME